MKQFTLRDLMHDCINLQKSIFVSIETYKSLLTVLFSKRAQIEK